MVNPWLQFLVCAVIIIFAGTRLTKYAAVVADNTGIGTAWVGAVMLPFATSLPELVTTLRAVTINTPDLALGNLLGSCLYNLALLAVIDLLEGRGAMTARINQGHIVTAALSIITVCLASIAMLKIAFLPLGWVGLETLIIALVYIFGSRLLYRYDQKNRTLAPQEKGITSDAYWISTGRALINFLVAALFIVLAGVYLTDAADQIAVTTGLGHTFVGSILLAISTSLPETVTTISALKMGLLNMAVANVFGANFMNLFIIFIADLFYRKAPLLYAVSDSNLLSALAVILFSTIIILGLIYRSERKFARIGFDALLILAGYLTVVYTLFRTSGN